uniref:Rho-GAP domain-containing protein n=1 Tax=Mycena chlorophos TaxID=658473 RepID=A0ABQ0LWP2_MYCCL|nr:predicted protein [Mycena chlorophos]
MRKYTLPYNATPSTLYPQTPHSASSSSTRLRSASTSASTPNTELPARQRTKRHTYHELQQLPQPPNIATPPNPWTRDRVASLPQIHTQPPQSTSTIPPLSIRPRRLEPIDPRPILRTLNDLLDPATQRIPEFLDVDHLVALYERDVMERDQREMIKIRARLDRVRNRTVDSNITVFGSSLRETTMYASIVTVLAGYEHDIPIVVFRCVKELCRTGVSPTDRKPDRDRLLTLISTFDAEPQFGSKTTFNVPHDLPEVYGLLTTFLFALPEPIISPEMFEAIWIWCIVPSLRSTDFMEDGHVRRYEASDTGVRICQLLLRLLPIPNFSLIVYFMGFFQRLPNLVTEDVGRAMLAGTCDKDAMDGRAERTPTMLKWFVERWDVILNALFEDPATASRIVRGPTLKIRVEARDEAKDDDDDASSVSSAGGLGERLRDLTQELAQDAQRETKLRNRRAVLHQASENTSPLSSSSGKPDVYVDADADVDSGYSSNLESPTSIIGIGEHESILQAAPPSPPAQEDPDHVMSLAQAMRRISLLERELERSDHAVEEAISKTFQAQSQVKELEVRLRAYEVPKLELRLDERRAADDWNAVLHSDMEALKGQLAEVTREKERMGRVVEDMKRVLKVNGL